MFRPSTSIVLRDNILISKNGKRVVLLPLDGRLMTLKIENNDDGQYLVVASRGEHHEPLAIFSRERQAAQLLTRISRPTQQRIMPLISTTSAVLIVMFSAWFLYWLPIDDSVATATALQYPAQHPAMAYATATQQQLSASSTLPLAQRPAMGRDPTKINETQALAETAPNPFGLQE